MPAGDPNASRRIAGSGVRPRKRESDAGHPGVGSSRLSSGHGGTALQRTSSSTARTSAARDRFHQLDMADPRRQDETDLASGCLLIELHAVEDRVTVDRPLFAGRVVGRCKASSSFSCRSVTERVNAAQGARPAGWRDHADGDRLAMEQGAVARQGLEGVGEGVAVVEQGRRPVSSCSSRSTTSAFSRQQRAITSRSARVPGEESVGVALPDRRRTRRRGSRHT